MNVVHNQHNPVDIVEFDEAQTVVRQINRGWSINNQIWRTTSGIVNGRPILHCNVR